MTIQDIIKIPVWDFEKLPLSTQRQYMAQLRRATTKRVQRLEKSGLYSPALEKLKKTGGRISTKGITTPQAMGAEYIRAKTFIKEPTSLVRNVRKLEKDLKEFIGIPNITGTQIYNIRKLYEELSEIDESVKSVKYDIMKTIPQYILDNPEVSADDIIKEIKKRRDEEYVKQEQAIQQFNEGTSEMFS